MLLQRINYNKSGEEKIIPHTHHNLSRFSTKKMLYERINYKFIHKWAVLPAHNVKNLPNHRLLLFAHWLTFPACLEILYNTRR